MPNILCVHLFKSTLSLVSCLALAFIMLFAQYEKTLITKLLYSISEVLVLVNLVTLFRMFILWLTFRYDVDVTYTSRSFGYLIV